MKIIKGIPASSGKSAGMIFRIKNSSESGQTGNCPSSLSIDLEIKQFNDACSFVKNRLLQHVDESRIFAAHLEILEDITDRVISKIERDKVDAISAVREICNETCALFAEMEDEYLRSRSDDITDVCRQLIFELIAHNENPYATMPAHSILIADNLLVSDTVLIDKSKLAGIALRKGSKTSHVAILARDHAIPLVLGIGEAIDDIPDDGMIVIDGDKGEISIISDESIIPSVPEQATIEKKADKAPAITKDGVEVKVYANAGSLADVEKAIALGADGIGVLRTEFIFMQATDFPDEAMQYATYIACAKACREKILTIRTLDAGADKPLPYAPVKKEENPVFGLRGIRFSLASPDIFKVQLRAILRASVLGNVRVMFPMITSLAEYRTASMLLEECKSELKNEGVAFDSSLRAGVMVETPASVILADDFARHASFFSIGVNDLTQYMLVVDRNNPYTENACDSFHSAVLKSISEVTASAARYGIDSSVCGEMASDLRATETLLKLGVRNLSVSPRQIPFLKEQIRKCVFYIDNNYKR
jgi:phosphotransferase system enzyme I (PtsI)